MKQVKKQHHLFRADGKTMAIAVEKAQSTDEYQQLEQRKSDLVSEATQAASSKDEYKALGEKIASVQSELAITQSKLDESLRTEDKDAAKTYQDISNRLMADIYTFEQEQQRLVNSYMKMSDYLALQQKQNEIANRYYEELQFGYVHSTSPAGSIQNPTVTTSTPKAPEPVKKGDTDDKITTSNDEVTKKPADQLKQELWKEEEPEQKPADASQAPSEPVEEKAKSIKSILTESWSLGQVTMAAWQWITAAALLIVLFITVRKR